MKQGARDVHVRSAEPDDAGAIDRLIRCLDELHAHARPDLFRATSGPPRGENFLQIALDDPLQKIFVAVSDGEVIGYVHTKIKNAALASHQVERRFSEIDTISVHPSAQGRGIGRRLIEQALSWAASLDIHDHQVGVHEFNRAARSLYEKLGFVASITSLRRTDRKSDWEG